MTQLSPYFRTLALSGIIIILTGVLVVLAFLLNTPLLASVRAWATPLVLSGSFMLGALSFRLTLRRWSAYTQENFNLPAALFVTTVTVLLFTSSGLVAVPAARFQYIKYQVLHSDSPRLREVGQHIIIGYRDTSRRDLEHLVATGRVGGIYITARNVADKNMAELKAEIAHFQTIRATRGLPPLVIAADQEGGGVARLSPPLPKQPTLREVLEDANPPDATARAQVMREYATAQARGLQNVGVTMNFSPVVDLRPAGLYPADKFTRLYERSIASDPAMVTEVARVYAQVLSEHSVRPTFKHFPGIGSVPSDTHLVAATSAKSLADLRAQDLLPFEQLSDASHSAMMLSHVVVPELDPDRPVSLSPAAVKLIRDEWGYNGWLVTDDLSMGAIITRPGGVGRAAQESLAAGVDYLLISFDQDLYYEVMWGVM